jgi:magnesium transporter
VDHLVDGYRVALRTVAGAVEQVQLKLFGEADDEMFRSVSELTRDILVFRKALMESRELIHEMASRRSLFVSETTQPFLGVLAGTLERLGDDLGTERDVLSETLNLYMGMVSHRTNKVVKRLTVISMIFLPLTFLTGVYGMNLIIPEARWAYTYLLFWVVVAALATTIVLVARRLKWL